MNEYISKENSSTGIDFYAGRLKMTIDEAIANYQGISNYLQRYYDPDAEVKLHITNGKCVEWFTEVAERLTELKEAKRLLKLAVEGFSNMYDHIFDCDGTCDTCPLHGERDHCLKWYYADEAEKIIKEENENDRV